MAAVALGTRALLAAVFAAIGSHAAGLPVRVALEWPSGRPTSAPARTRIQAVRTTGPTAGGLPVEADAGPDGVVLDLGDGIWRVEASAPGYWSPGAEVAIGRDAPAPVRLALWPAASLHGTIETAGRDPSPRHLDVRLSAVRADGGEPNATPSPAGAELRCPLDAGAWTCLGPAGLFDVQIEAAGYAPLYRWNVRLDPATSADLGRTLLSRTSSVFGRAVGRDGANPRGPCRATLEATDQTRRGSAPPESASGGEGAASLSVAVSPRGYFQMFDVPAGGHLLAVECEAASGFRELRVAADRETRIDPPLQLEELTLEVAVTPGVDPEGRPWQLNVDAIAPRWRRIVGQATVPADGAWARPGLTAGSYGVTLSSADGTPWLRHFFRLGPDTGPMALRPGFVEVAGRVTLNARPLRARLVFVNEGGGEPATLTSDDAGRFQGRLPVAPDVVETLWTVEAQATEPPVNRRLEHVRVQPAAGETKVRLDLALPTAAVRGTVASEEGDPQTGAQVVIEDTRSGAETVTGTDDAGGFELLELPPGSYTAVAQSVEGASEPAAFEVAEGVESVVDLVLRRSERIAFQVVGSQGAVADAAVQVWVPPGVPRGFQRADPDGRFDVSVPPGTTDLALTVGAPGHALKLTRLTVSSEQTLTLGASGGSLVLDLERPERVAGGDATPYLVHNGAIEAAGALAGWGTAAAGTSRGGPAVLEAIEPGLYALCLAGPEELAALWRGALPPGRCRTGSVEPGRTLILSLP